MTAAERKLLKRIEQLEKEVAELKARVPVVINIPAQQPITVPNVPMPYSPYRGPIITNGNTDAPGPTIS